MESTDYINNTIKELNVKTTLLGWYSAVIQFIGLATPLIFLLYGRTFLHFISILILFVGCALFLRVQYVRSVNKRNINLYLISKLNEERNSIINSVFRN